jgi:Leucine-rich repeat (LRR) protein
MHDIVRSFAQYVTRDEALVCHNSDIYISDKLKSEKFIRLSIEKEGSKTHDFEWCSLQTQKSLRTLISVGHIKIKPGDSLVPFSCLRTLYMESVNFDELGESLYQLKHLRYLSIENSETSVLPENIGKLKFLQYISLFGCKSLVKLPSSIGMLQHLRQLDIRGTSINTIPKGFCGSTCLTTLYGFPAHMDGDWCSLEELGPLSQLVNVGIHFLENVASASFATQARLGEKNRLRLLAMICMSRHQNDELLVKEEEGISEKAKRQIEEVFDELFGELHFCCPPRRVYKHSPGEDQ